jgi:hypothetical protein
MSSVTSLVQAAADYHHIMNNELKHPALLGIQDKVKEFE